MADVMVEHSVEVSALGAKRRSAQGGSMDKLKDVLGVDDSGLVKALGDGNMVWQEVEERIVDGGREASIRRAQKSKKAQQILGISRTTIALMNKLGVSESELLEALQAEAEQQYAAQRAETDRAVVKSNRLFTKALQRLGVDPVHFVIEKRLGLQGKELDEAVLRTQMAAMEQQLQQLEEDQYFEEHHPTATDLSLDEPSSLSAGSKKVAHDIPPKAQIALRSSEKLRHIFGLDESALCDIAEGNVTDEDADVYFSEDEQVELDDLAANAEAETGPEREAEAEIGAEAVESTGTM